MDTIIVLLKKALRYVRHIQRDSLSKTTLDVIDRALAGDTTQLELYIKRLEKLREVAGRIILHEGATLGEMSGFYDKHLSAAEVHYLSMTMAAIDAVRPEEYE